MISTLEKEITLRFLKARKKDGFLNVISIFSFIGISLGVAVLIIVMSVMNGFRSELINKIVGFNAHITVKSYDSSINQKKKISLERLIYSLGIRHIGLENAKLLAKYFKQFSNLKSLNNYDDLINIDGIGETQVNSIKNFFSNKINLKVINELQKILSIKNASIDKKNGILKNQTFMLTGKLNGISRAEAKSLIEENSGTTVSSVSKKLNYLIVGEKPTKRKIETAKELKVTIIDQSQFLRMLDKTS